MRIRLVILGMTAVSIPLSFVHSPYPNELLLQHVPTVLAVLGLLSICFCYPLSRISFGCIVAFLWLHIIGARWIYSFVPYDDWTQMLTGKTLSEQFGWQRNHYDRLVHFASGILGVPPIAETLQRVSGMRPLGATVMAISGVLSIGALYEVLEWQIAIAFSPSQAEAYNGQQGDVWDPQKDLALAFLGAILSAGLTFRWCVLRSPQDPI